LKTPTNREAAITYWREQARLALDSARAELSAGRHHFAINRAYYAAFYAASAVLLRRDRRYARHATLRGAVHRVLVKGGLLESELGRDYDQLFESRQRVDYIELVTVDPENAADLIHRAETLAFDRLLSQQGESR